MAVTTSEYFFGMAELAVIAASLGLGAFNLRKLLVPAWTGALARLAEFVIAISALVVVAEVLGALKQLEETPLVIACVVVGLGGAWLARARGARWKPDAPEVKPSRAMLAIAIIAAAVVVTHWAQPTEESLDRGMYYQDTTWYHMSFSARFAETGEVGPLHFTDPTKLAPWFYPQSSELLHAVGITTLDSDFLSLLINLGWVSLCLLAAWCVGRPYAVGAVTVLGAAVVLDSEMLVDSQAGNAPNDIMGIFFLLATLAFLVDGAASARAAPEIAAGAAAEVAVGGDTDEIEAVPVAADSQEAAELRREGALAQEYLGFPEEPEPGPIEEVPVAGSPRVLAGIGVGPLFIAGLAAGLGIGTKITLLPTLGILTIGLAILGGRQHWLRTLGIWLGGMIITSGFWYGRNIVKAANPFPQIEKLGPIDLPGPQQISLYPRPPHTVGEFLNDPLVWEHKFFPVLNDRIGPLWPAVLAAVIVGLILVLFRGRTSLMRVLGITGIVAGVAYIVTPLTASGDPYDPSGFDANLRYAAPAMIVALMTLPLVPALRRGRWPWVLIGIFALLILQGTVTQLNWQFGHLDESLELAMLIVGVPTVMIAASRAGVTPMAVGIFGVGAVVLAVFLGKTQEEQYLANRYEIAVRAPLSGGFRSTPDWLRLQAFGQDTTDSRIGVVGRASAFGQYFFYGHDLSNFVQYIGGRLKRGTFRPIRNCDNWRRAINAGDYDYVITTPTLEHGELHPPQENLWTRKDKNAEVLIESGPARVFTINGQLDPVNCAKLGDRARAQPALPGRL